MLMVLVVLGVVLVLVLQVLRGVKRVDVQSYSLIMCGWRKSWRYWISRSMRPAMSLVTSFLLLMIFRATFSPVTSCIASLTLPNEPSPSVFTTLYWPSRAPGREAWSLSRCRCEAVAASLSSRALRPFSECGGLCCAFRRTFVLDIESESSSSSSAEAISRCVATPLLRCRV